jgi:hypothetical protein
MNLFKSKSAKKKKLEKQIRSVKPEIVTQLLHRYNRFCMDQHAFTWLSWRIKYLNMGLSTKEKMIFRLRIALRKESGLKLFTRMGEVNHNPESLGRPVEHLPPCLDPDFP